jgi:hypothetical protein
MKQCLDDTRVLPFRLLLSLVVVFADMFQVVSPRQDDCRAESTTPDASDRGVLNRIGCAGSGVEAVVISEVLGQEGCSVERSWTAAAHILFPSVMKLEFVQLPLRLCLEGLATKGADVTRTPRKAALAMLVVHRARR